MKREQAIRSIFLSPFPAYSVSEAAELLGWNFRSMARAVANGEIETAGSGSNMSVSWQEIAAMATTQWSQQVIEEALGEQVNEVMPNLVRLAELRVRVPRYEIVMLKKLAERERMSVGEYLANHLLDLASAETEWLEQVAPRVGAAMRWPQTTL